MTTDYRAMCAELAEELVNEYGYCTEWEKGLPLCESNVSELLTRARALLDQQEPEGPSDEDLWELYDDKLGQFGFAEDWPWIRNYARAVLDKWGHQCLALNRSDKSQMPFSGIACQPLKRIAKYESSRGKKTDRTKGFCPKTLFGYY
jgi:hypothetical protein